MNRTSIEKTCDSLHEIAENRLNAENEYVIIKMQKTCVFDAETVIKCA